MMVVLAQTIIIFFLTFSDTCHVLRDKEIAVGTSALWLDSVLSSGMKLIKSDPAVSPAGMLAQSLFAAIAGIVLSLTIFIPSNLTLCQNVIESYNTVDSYRSCQESSSADLM